MLTTKDEKFKKYGFCIDIDAKDAVFYLQNIPLPETGNRYVAGDPEFEKIPVIKKLGKQYFEDYQAGHVCGNNQLLNCAEYHNCVEINIAAEDITLFLATLNDVKDGQIDASSFDEVLVKKGEVILLYSGVLHFSPCRTSKEGFHTAVILSKGTNLDLKEKHPEDPWLWKTNKWLIAHKDTVQASQGAYVGITGTNRYGSLAR